MDRYELRIKDGFYEPQKSEKGYWCKASDVADLARRMLATITTVDISPDDVICQGSECWSVCDFIAELEQIVKEGEDGENTGSKL